MSVVILGGNECMEKQYSNACRTAGAELAADSVTANDAPGDEETQQCRNLGAALV